MSNNLAVRSEESGGYISYQTIYQRDEFQLVRKKSTVLRIFLIGQYLVSIQKLLGTYLQICVDRLLLDG